MLRKARFLLSFSFPDGIENRSVWVALVAAILILCLLGLPLFQGLVHKHDDLARYHLPFRFFYAQSLKAGDSFVWLPNAFCGFYIHGDGSAGMCHPLHLVLYRTLPFVVAFNLEMLLNYPFMMAGMFLFLRRWKIPREAGMLGAFVFAFSGFNLLHYAHLNAVVVAAHIPWLLLAIDVVVRGTDKRQVAVAKLGVTLLTASQLLLGHPQVFWFSSLVEFLYVLLLVSSWWSLRRLLSLGASKILGVLAGSIQLLPSWDVLSNSVRPESFSRTWPSLQPIHILQLVAPYFFNDDVFEGIPYELKIYNGAIPLALLVFLFIRRKEWGTLRLLATGALGLGVLSLVLALGEYGYLYRLQMLLPLVGLFRAPCRYILLFHLAAAIWAAIAFADLSRLAQRGERLAWRELWPLVLVPFASLLPLMVSLLAKLQFHPALTRYFVWNIAPKSLVIAGPAFLILASAIVVMASRGIRYALVGIILFAAMDQGVYGISYILRFPAVDIKSFLDSRPTPPEASRYRLQSQDNVLIMKGIRLADGYVSIPPKKQLDDLSPARLEVAGVRWIWAKRPQSLNGRAYGVQVPKPLPRARLVSKVLVSPDPNRDIDIIDPDSTALVSKEIELPGGKPGKAAIVSDRPGKIRLAAEADSKQLLVLSESYHEGWRVRIDDKESSVLRVYGDFMGCVVDAGKHEVEFTFRPRSLRVGGWLSALGLGLSLVSFFFSLLPRRV